MLEAVIFDFDGVIVDSYDCYFSCWARACGRADLARLATADVFLRLFETNFRVGLAGLGLGGPRTEALLEYMLRELESGFTPRGFQPGIPECLDRLSRAADIHVVTSSPTAIVHDYLERGGVSSVQSILGLDVEPSKVVKIRRVMADRDADRCFYVGDTLGDMLEAREAGARSVAAAWGWHSADLLRRGRPDHIASSPAELADLLTGTSA